MQDNHTVTAADHDAGFKELEIVYRNGNRETIKLLAPSYRTAQKLALELQKTREVTCVTAAVLPGIAARMTMDAFLSKLTVESASLVETIAFALTFGSDFQKKMEELGERLQRTMDSTDSAPKFSLSVPAMPPGRSENIHCPSCGCTIGLSGNSPLSSTFATSGSAPPAA